MFLSKLRLVYSIIIDRLITSFCCEKMYMKNILFPFLKRLGETPGCFAAQTRSWLRSCTWGALRSARTKKRYSISLKWAIQTSFVVYLIKPADSLCILYGDRFGLVLGFF